MTNRNNICLLSGTGRLFSWFILLLVMLLSSPAMSLGDISTGLISHYLLDGNLIDSVAGIEGVNTGTTATSDRLERAGKAIYFDGSDYVTVTDVSALQNLEQLTVSTWVKLDNLSHIGRIVCQWADPAVGNSQESFTMTFQQGKFRISLDTVDNHYPNHVNFEVPATLQANVWYHFVMVYDGTTITTYVNGVKYAGPAATGNITNRPRPMYFGQGGSSVFPNYLLQGSLDEVRIYNRALSESDVSQIYALEKQAVDFASGLIAYYEFEGNGNDSSGNDHDGTEYGGVNYVAGKNGQAAIFDGMDDMIRVNSLWPTGDSSQPLSLSTWVKIDDDNRKAMAIASQWTACGGSNDHYHLTLYGDTLSYIGLRSKIPKDSVVTIPRSTITDNKWHHLAITFNGSSHKLYLDSSLKTTSSTFSAFNFNQSTDFVIGGYHSDSCGFGRTTMKGLIDDLRIYNRALSPLEIKALYNQNSDILPTEISQSTPTEENQATSTYAAAFDGRTLTCGSPGPVVASSGNFTHSHTDFIIPSLGPNLNITRYYNSQDLYDGPFGHGWNMDYTAQLVIAEEQDGTTSATVRLGNGVRRKFTTNGDGTFSASQGQDDTLFNTGTVDTPVYVFNGACGSSCTPKPRTAYTFNAGGWLTAISDRNNNQLTIGYDGLGRVSTVTDASGRDLNFSYGTNGRVQSVDDFSGRNWSYGYDNDDNLTSATDPLSNILTYQYDTSHNLTTVIDPLGNTVASASYDTADKATSFAENGGDYQLSYDPVSQVTNKMNPAGGLFQFEYDTNGNITNKTGPLGKSLALSWDTDVNLSSKTNGLGVVTDYSYDAQHNVTAIIRDVGGLNVSTAFQYDPVTGQVSQVTDPAGSISTMSYDANGNLLTKTMPIGSSQYTYNSNGLPTLSTDPDGVQTGYEYDANGYLLRTWIVGTNPLVETTYTYDQRSNRLTSTDPLGNTTNYTYDSLNNLTGVEDALMQTVSFQYDGNSNLTSMTNAGGIVTNFVYDNYNRMISKIEAASTPLERSTSYTYDSRGNLLTMTNPMGYTTSYTYDELSRQTRACDHLNQCWAFTYDEVGNLIAQTDPNTNTTSYTFDAVGRLASVADAEGNTTSYSYDANSNLLTVIDANANTATTNTYDANNRLTSTKDALNNTTTSTYTDGGRLATVTDANSQVSSYAYDAVSGYLTEIQYPAGRTLSFTYDLTGHILTISDSSTAQTITYTYDALGRLASETQLGQTLSYSYDINGKRLAVSLAGVGDYSYAHDELNHYIAVTNPDFETTSFEYNGADQRTRTTYGNSSYTDYSYDEAGRLTAVSHHKGDAVLIASFTYTYDAMGNRLSETNSTGTITYTYDKTYKLLSATYPDGEVISFTYDAVGNRLSKTDSNGTTTYTYDVVNRLVGETRPDTSTVAYTWDGNGNIQTRTQTNADTTTEITGYTYDSLNKLVQLDLPDGTSNSYTYDPVGRRMRSSDGTTVTRFLYDGKNPLADISGDDAAPVYQTLYTPALGLDVLASRKQGAATQYFLRDGLNSVRLVLNSDATVAATYDYQPYGAVRSQTGSSDNMFAFTGRRAEGNNGLMYYRTRYYDPAVGRFLKKDGYTGSIGEPLSLHRYGYVHGNPVNYVDPLGNISSRNKLFLEGAGGLVLGGIALGAIATGTVAASPAILTVAALGAIGTASYGAVNVIEGFVARDEPEASYLLDTTKKAQKLSSVSGSAAFSISSMSGVDIDRSIEYAGWATFGQGLLISSFSSDTNPISSLAGTLDNALSFPGNTNRMNGENDLLDYYSRGDGTIMPPYLSDSSMMCDK